MRDCLGPHADPPPELRTRVHEAFGPDGFSVIAAPADAAGVAAVLAAASRARWPVAPLGAGTWPLATAPSRPDAPPPRPVVLSTSRLDRIVEHEPADLVVGVQAGMPLRRLENALAEHRQWLPLDPPAHPDATIGAAAALASAGPLRAAYGTPRDLALGVEIATGDGRLLRFGGRVVKNVAGYDGVRLAMGSAGRLGVITCLYLKVSGQPRTDSTLAMHCGCATRDARTAMDLALEIRQGVACDALEIAGPTLAEAIGAGARQWTVLVRLLGNEAAVAEGARRVRALAEKRSAAGPGSVMADREVWDRLSRTEAYARVAVRLSGRLTDVAEGLALADGLDGVQVAAHAATGVVRAWATDDGGDALAALERAGREQGWAVRSDRVRMVGGGDAVGRGRASGRAGAAGRIETAIRGAFDPSSVLLAPDWGE